MLSTTADRKHYYIRKREWGSALCPSEDKKNHEERKNTKSVSTRLQVHRLKKVQGMVTDSEWFNKWFQKHHQAVASLGFLQCWAHFAAPLQIKALPSSGSVPKFTGFHKKGHMPSLSNISNCKAQDDLSTQPSVQSWTSQSNLAYFCLFLLSLGMLVLTCTCFSRWSILTVYPPGRQSA